MDHPPLRPKGPAQPLLSRWGLAAALTLVLVVLVPAGVQAQGSLWDQIERSAGEAAYPELVARYGGIAPLPEEHLAWLKTIFERVAAQSSRAGAVEYSLTVLNTDLVNAFALPGGFVFVTRGLLDLTAWDPHQLANVMGHEVAHIDQDHYRDGIIRQLGIAVFIGIFFREAVETQVVQQLVNLAADLIDKGWSRDDEHEADQVGQRFAAQAGFDPAGLPAFLERLHEEERRSHGPQVAEVLRTHPLTENRIAAARERLPQLQSIYERSRQATVAPPSRVGLDEAAARYRDPLGRYTFTLPDDWRAGRSTTSATTTVLRSRDGRIFFVHVYSAPSGNDGLESLAAQLLTDYQEAVPGFELIQEATPSRLGDERAVYFEYRYVDEDGRRLREGSFVALHEQVVYLFQYADNPERFEATVGDFYHAAETFAYR